MTYENAISEIEKVLKNMENSDQNIETLIADVKYASELITFCKNKLHGIEDELNQIFQNEEE